MQEPKLEQTKKTIKFTPEYRRQYIRQYKRQYRLTHPQYREKQKKLQAKWLKNHPDYHRNYKKKWKKAHHSAVLEWNRRYRRRNPDKQFARNKTRFLKFDRCVLCGAIKKIERHHPDYAQPLLIIPLCHDCHVKQHKAKGRIKIEP